METAVSRKTHVRKIDDLESLEPWEREALRPVGEKFAFRASAYYLSLIDWSDPRDPLRRIVVPRSEELVEFGEWDASDEASYMVADGLEHKYADTALILVNKVCAAYCRFCFRKRLFTADNEDVANDLGEALSYLRRHPEINNVLLSGGDPLVLSTRRLENVLRELSEIDHVNVIRIGSKVPAFDPDRIVGDPALPDMLGRHVGLGKQIYVMAHFSHPRELTEKALKGMSMLRTSGVATVNQTPIIRGVNDDASVLSELLDRLSFNGIVPYYLFICRPTAGNDPYVVPVEETLEIVETARAGLSGLAKQARLCMSHKTGKVEVVGKTGGHVVFRYHRAVDPFDRERLWLVKSNPRALWLDDYLENPNGTF